MHELSFAVEILERIEHAAREYPDSKVVRVRLSAGPLLGLDLSSLTFCLEGIAAGTVLDGARIEAIETGLELECPQCGHVPAVLLRNPVCPACGQRGEISGGGDLVIEEIELYEHDDQT